MIEYAVEVNSVVRSFGEKTVVNGLSFCVERGTVFGLLGPNGAGKTTTIRLVTGLLSRDRGEIRVMGNDPQDQAKAVRQCIGLVPQQTNVYLELNALDNLWHHAALYSRDLSGVGDRIAFFLKLVNLWDRRLEPVGNYSGGMQRRLAFVRSLLHDPEVIFFDEPSLGVDVQGKHSLWQHIREQRNLGKTFIVSTNDMAEAEILCDKLLIIDHGKAVALDTPENLKRALGRDVVTIRTIPAIADPVSLFVGVPIHHVSKLGPDVIRFETPNAETLAGTLVDRVTREHHLESIRIARPTLDDVFLSRTGRALRE